MMLPAEIEQLFHTARSQPAGERMAFLRRACGNDHDRIALLATLLASDEAAGTFLEMPPLGLIAADAPMDADGVLPVSSAARVGTRIGRYQILRIIAAGGMGVVYEAEQEAPHRRVALKLLRRVLYGSAALRRFQREAELLGRLHHRGIAHIYEAGVHGEDGEPVPFFAMELLDGAVPITSFARDRALSVKRKLELLALVCDAVHYCHEEGVVHRDLKPANILVTPGLEPKVIDFGVAQAHAGSQSTWHTTGTPLIGSLAYMSPEQAGSQASSVDAQSDVFALGVVAYELLAGRLPLDLSELPPLEAARRIHDEEPPALGQLDRSFRGDLELIVATAMAKEKSRRYPSAAALAADLRRWRTHQPIRARRPGVLYRFGKFARRNRALTVGLTVAFVGLFIGGAASTWWGISAAGARVRAEVAAAAAEQARESEARERRRAEQQRMLAEANAARSRKITGYVRDLLTSSRFTQNAERGRNLTVDEMLDEAAQILGAQLEDEPEIQIAILETIGGVLTDHGRYQAAERHFDAALALAEEIESEELIADALMGQVRNASAFGKADFAPLEKLVREALGIRARLFGPDSEQAAKCYSELANLLCALDRPVEAEQAARASLGTFRKLFGDNHVQVGIALMFLGKALKAQDRLDEAKHALEQAGEIFIQTGGNESHLLSWNLADRARLARRARDLSSARKLIAECLRMRRKLLGDGHFKTREAIREAAWISYDSNQYAVAEALFLELQSDAGQGDVDSYDAAFDRFGLAWSLHDQGKFAAAEPVFQEALVAFRSDLPEEQGNISDLLAGLGRILVDFGQYEEAECLLRECLEIRERLYPGEHPNGWARYGTITLWGAALAGQAADAAATSPEVAAPLFHDAESLLIAGYFGMIASGPAGDADGYIHDSLRFIVDLYDSREAAEPGQGHGLQAAAWRSRLAEFSNRAASE